MIITGQNPPIVETNRDIAHDPNYGDKVIVTYEGTQEAIYAAYNSVDNRLIKRIDSSDKPRYRLIVESPDASGGTGTDSPPVVIYEMISNPAQRSGFEHYKSQLLSKTDLRRVRDSLTLNILPKDFSQTRNVTDASGKITVVPNPLYKATNWDSEMTGTLYDLMLNGRDSFDDTSYAFRVTEVISPRALSIASANRGRIYTAAQVISETDAPEEYASAINNVTNSYPHLVPTGDVLGWLKRGVGFTKMAGDKLAVVVEYWLESWTTYYYDQL